MNPRIGVFATLAAGQLLLMGCDKPTGGTLAAGTTRDSLAIEILTFQAVDTGKTFAHLGAPSATIGGHDSDTNQIIFARPLVRLLPSGRIVIALPKRGSAGPSLRIYERDGRFARTLARSGTGPGELQSVDGLIVTAAGTIALVDDRAKVLHHYAESGNHIRDVRLSGTGNGMSQHVYGIFADGSLLTGEETPDPDLRAIVNPVVRSSHVVRLDSAAMNPRSLGTHFRGQHWVYLVSARSGLSDGLYAPSGYLVAQDSTWLHADGGTGQIREFGIDGALHRVLHTRLSRDPITQAAIREVMESRNPGPNVRRAYGARQFPNDWPDSAPAFDALMSAGSTEYWIRPYEPEFPQTTHTLWLVFTSAGEFRGSVRVPANTTLEHVRGDIVAGISEDSSGAIRVYTWSLRRQ